MLKMKERYSIVRGQYYWHIYDRQEKQQLKFCNPFEHYVRKEMDRMNAHPEHEYCSQCCQKLSEKGAVYSWEKHLYCEYCYGMLFA